MSGYDTKKNTNPLNLMAKQLGVYYQEPTATTVNYADDITSVRSLMAHRLGMNGNKTVNASAVLDGIDQQSASLVYNGGHAQQDRMIRDKRRTLDRVVLYSYQGADVKKVDADEDERPIRALINPNKVKQDYDDKVISVGYEFGYKPGDIFTWIGTNTQWLIYLQDLTELAYFRGDIRKCSYKMNWKDEDGNLQSTYAAIRGPVETKINTSTKNGTQYNFPNYTLSLLIPKNEATLKHFRRYTKFYLRDKEEGAPEVCWRVNTANWVSMPGIIELTAEEYYINEDLDDIEEGIVGRDEVILLAEEEPEETENKIEGETFIKAKKTYTYEYQGEQHANAKFIVDQKKYPITIISEEENAITLKWNTSYHGQFELQYGYSYDDIITNEDFSTTIVTKQVDLAKKTIVVESLF